MDELLKYFSVMYQRLFYLSQIPEMKKQDAEESAMQGSEDAPPTAGGMESPAAAKDSLDSNSPKESEPETPQTDSPPQGDEAASEGKVFIILQGKLCVVGMTDSVSFVSWEPFITRAVGSGLCGLQSTYQYWCVIL